MPYLRTFVAVELGPDVRSRAAAIIKLFRAVQTESKAARWVDTEQMHLTLKFLGDVDARQIPEVCQALSEVAGTFPPFDILVQGVGAFPNAARPRTIWLGIDDDTGRLQRLHAALDEALGQLGFARENRRFHPHLTLGRVKLGVPEFEPVFAKLADYEAGITGVDELVAFASYLERAGPTYDALGRAELKGN